MFFYILMIIIGFVLLVLGAELLVRGASNIAKKFHITEMLIGLTIVAIGTSAPELIITITSANSGATDLIIGNAIGSNLCNLLLILGLMAIIHPIIIDKEVRKIHLPIAILAPIILLIMEILQIRSEQFNLDKADGIILIILFELYFLYPIIKEIKGIVKTIKEDNEKTSNINLFKSIFIFIVGVILLKYGGDFVVDNATNIAEQLNVPERVIGLTIIAIGTAMPELVTSIIAVLKKDTDLAVGNLVGSCIFNIFLILGVGASITQLEFSTEFNQNLILLIVSTFIVWLFNFIGKKNVLTRSKGVILLLIFSFYIVNLFV